MLAHYSNNANPFSPNKLRGGEIFRDQPVDVKGHDAGQIHPGVKVRRGPAQPARSARVQPLALRVRRFHDGVEPEDVLCREQRYLFILLLFLLFLIFCRLRRLQKTPKKKKKATPEEKKVSGRVGAHTTVCTVPKTRQQQGSALRTPQLCYITREHRHSRASKKRGHPGRRSPAHAVAIADGQSPRPLQGLATSRQLLSD